MIRLYQDAYLHSIVRHNPTSGIIAIIIFDLANETMLKTVASTIKSLRRGKDKDKDTFSQDFSGAIQSARAMLSKEGLGTLPDELQIEHIHSLRNDAQHKARYPNAEEVADCRAYTRAFLSNITQQVWGEDFSRIGMIDLVENVRIKEMLQRAQENLENNEYINAIAWASIAFDSVFNTAKEEIVGRQPREIGVEATSAAIPNYFAHLSRLLVIQTTGLSVSKLKEFNRNRAYVSAFYQGGDKINTVITGPRPTEDMAKAAVPLAIEIIVQIETALKNFS